MTREEIDIMWQQALQDSVRDGEMFTRYHFAKMVSAKEREACAKVCDKKSVPQKGKLRNDVQCGAVNLANAIRARGEA